MRFLVRGVVFDADFVEASTLADAHRQGHPDRIRGGPPVPGSV